MAKSIVYRKLIAKLRKIDNRFVVITNRGKGSERMIFHPDVNGRSESYPVKCHGEGTEIPRGTVSAIIKRFGLPADAFDN